VASVSGMDGGAVGAAACCGVWACLGVGEMRSEDCSWEGRTVSSLLSMPRVSMCLCWERCTMVWLK
jgi:hypothetical protein